MQYYRIRGKKRLMGEIDIGGAKNAVLPILAAMCLNKSVNKIYNCPPIADTFASIEILEGIGCKVTYEGTTMEVDTSGALSYNIPEDVVGKMRSSILFMGAMLGRMGKVNIALPGGCDLGVRAIDLHISGLTQMGAEICIKGNTLICTAPKLCGAHLQLHTPSVGATENLMLAAVLAEGQTVIENAAQEPEIVDLAKFLVGMGAKITGAGTSIITIIGVTQDALVGGEPHTVMPDRIVAGTYLVAAAMTGGMVTLRNISPTDLAPILTPLRAMGCTTHGNKTCVTLAAPKQLKPLKELVTAVHPGFPTDMQAQFVAALSLANGTSLVRETIFESRHAHAYDLNRMGAKITTDAHTFVIEGVPQLQGATVAAKDLRGGAALILAALAAEGETIVHNPEYVQRGYAHIERDLSKLGADIILEIGS